MHHGLRTVLSSSLSSVPPNLFRTRMIAVNNSHCACLFNPQAAWLLELVFAKELHELVPKVQDNGYGCILATVLILLLVLVVVVAAVAVLVIILLRSSVIVAINK